MDNDQPGWRAKLEMWLQSHPKTMPDDKRRLLDEFNRRFPKERLSDLTIEQYTQGRGDKDNFCWWLEWGTEKLGSVRGGSVDKWGVWWDKQKNDYAWNIKNAASAEDAFHRVRDGLQALVQAVEEGRFTDLDSLGATLLGPNLNSLRLKPLYLYFPDEFVPVMQPRHLAHYLRLFGADPEEGLTARNRQLLDLLRRQPEFAGLDSQQAMTFFYDDLPPDPLPPSSATDKAKYYMEVLLANLSRRQQALTTLADAIEYAHQASGGNWQVGLLHEPLRLQLIVHGPEAISIDRYGNGTYSIHLDAARVTPEVLNQFGVHGHSWGEDDKLSPQAMIASIPVSRLPERLPLVLNASHSFIDKAAGGEYQEVIQSRKAAHDPAVLAYIRAALQRDLPEPQQVGDTGGSVTEGNGGHVMPAPKELQPLLDLAARTRNLILYGPPGTGKTWLVRRFAHHFVSDNPDVSVAQATQDDLRFWWITARPDLWDWDELFAGEQEEFFSEGKMTRYFQEAQPGDIVFGYKARPAMSIVALAEVKEGLHKVTKDGEEVLGITIKPLQRLESPVTWQQLVTNPLLKHSQPVKQSARGRLFALRPAEVAELFRLIEAAGNSVPQQLRGTNSSRSVDSAAGPTSKDHLSRFVRLVTFHQSFAYEDFVEGLKPLLSDESAELGYDVPPGAFKEIASLAADAWKAHKAHHGNDNAPRFLLVIDEINRANIAKVFGELITLIEDDKRLGQENEIVVTLPYSGDSFGVPPNLYIVGTMNTADRSIALLDIALRRRFAFMEMAPDPSLLGSLLGLDLAALLQNLNERLRALLDRDHMIGHSYLMNLKSAGDLHFAWYNRIVPLLQEYFYNDVERLRAVLGDRLLEKTSISAATKKALGDLYEADTQRYQVRELSPSQLIEALRQIAGETAPVDGNAAPGQGAADESGSPNEGVSQ